MATTMNLLEIDGFRAVVQYDPETEMFRGDFLGLKGGADFYATTVKGLRTEGRKSLKVFLEMCDEKGIEPRKEYSGKFNLRVQPTTHEKLSVRAAAAGKSLNQFVAEVLDESVL